MGTSQRGFWAGTAARRPLRAASAAAVFLGERGRAGSFAFSATSSRELFAVAAPALLPPELPWALLLFWARWVF